MPSVATRVRRSPFARPVAVLMSPVGPTVRSEDDLGRAMHQFLVSGRRHLVVVDDHDRCVGILSDREVLAVWPTTVGWLRRRRVGELLRHTSPAIEPDVTVAQTAILMAAYGVDALPVVDAGQRPLGIVTDADIVTLVGLAG